MEEKSDRLLPWLARIMIFIFVTGFVIIGICEWEKHDFLETTSHYWLKFAIVMTWVYFISFNTVAIFFSSFFESLDDPCVRVMFVVAFCAALLIALSYNFEFAVGDPPLWVSLLVALGATGFLIVHDVCIVYDKIPVKAKEKWRDSFDVAIRIDLTVFTALFCLFLYVTFFGVSLYGEAKELYIFTAGAVSMLMIVNLALFSAEVLWPPKRRMVKSGQ